MNLDEGVEFLQTAAGEELKQRHNPLVSKTTKANLRGIRWGAFRMLVSLGYEDVAEEAMRSLYEDKGRSYDRAADGGMWPMTLRKMSRWYDRMRS